MECIQFVFDILKLGIITAIIKWFFVGYKTFININT
jgi:hypothetical protein